jgi:hypothetical protein
MFTRIDEFSKEAEYLDNLDYMEAEKYYWKSIEL